MSPVGWRIAAGAFPLRSKSKFDLRADDGESGAADDVPMKPIDTSPAPPAIVVQGLTKRYGELTAVDDLSFSVRRGTVTGFLGPNGAGKTTALKTIVGIARPTAGRALINGAPIEAAHADARVLGVYIEPTGAHPGRSARNHLRSLAAMVDIPSARVEEVLEIVELSHVAGRRVGKYSTGMRHR